MDPHQKPAAKATAKSPAKPTSKRRTPVFPAYPPTTAERDQEDEAMPALGASDIPTIAEDGSDEPVLEEAAEALGLTDRDLREELADAQRAANPASPVADDEPLAEEQAEAELEERLRRERRI